MEKKSFSLYLHYRAQFSMLSDEQAGKLIKGILEYANTSVVPTLPIELVGAFSAIRITVDRDMKNWHKIDAKRAELRERNKQK